MIKENIAIATLLYSPDYLPGVFTLGFQLNKLLNEVSLNFKTILFITPEVKESALTELSINLINDIFDEVITIQPLTANDKIIKKNKRNLQLLERPELAYALIKARIWEQTQFDQILYLDADTLPLNTSLFDVFQLTKDQTHLQVAASADIGWPDLFNSGVMSIVPNTNIAEELEQFILNETSIDGADQGILNQFFNANCRDITKDHPNFKKDWIILPFLYNVTTPNNGYQCPPALNFFKDQIKLIHFIGKTKPWKIWTSKTFIPNEYTNQWHSIYNEFCEINNIFEGYRHEEQQTKEEKEDIEKPHTKCENFVEEISQQEEEASNELGINEENPPLKTNLKPYVQREIIKVLEEKAKEEENKPEEVEIPAPTTPVVIPLDFREWLTTFISKDEQQEQQETSQQENNEETSYQEIQQYQEPQDYKQPQHHEEFHEHQHFEGTNQHVEENHEQEQFYQVQLEHSIEKLDLNELENLPEDNTESQTTECDEPKSVEGVVVEELISEPIPNFQFDWEINTNYKEHVERIFPGDIFEYEVPESEVEDDNDDPQKQNLTDNEDGDSDDEDGDGAGVETEDPIAEIYSKVDEFGLCDYIDIDTNEHKTDDEKVIDENTKTRLPKVDGA